MTPDRKAELQKRMPLVSAFVSEIREHFPDAQVTWCREGGLEFGQQDTREYVWTDITSIVREKR